MAAAQARGPGRRGDRGRGPFATMDPLQRRLLDLIEDQRLRVPVLPKVATEVLRMIRDEDSDVAKLSGLVHTDPSVAARVVRLANSAAYAPRSPITSVPVAIARIGTRALGETVLAIAIESGVFHVPGFEAELTSQWRHSVGAACYARELARTRGRDGDEAFLCGLLHGIGQPVLLQAGIEEASALGIPTKGAAARVRLFAAASALAPAAGAMVTARWELPAPVVAAARHHDDPSAAGPHAVDCALVFVARQLTACALAPEDSSPDIAADGPGFALLSLGEPELAALLARRTAVRAEVDAMTGA